MITGLVWSLQTRFAVLPSRFGVWQSTVWVKPVSQNARHLVQLLLPVFQYEPTTEAVSAQQLFPAATLPGTSVVGPEHALPPHEAAGLLQLRVLVRVWATSHVSNRGVGWVPGAGFS